ncbi:hypothetical protein R3P38DRAFT_3547975 [Favolaschia claudopus]|uniref:Polyprotein protein n=1 Tax=Favolaschia claudopus TaxID=2862362 RepID=A0AAW0B5B9_9AGAR
MFELPKTRVPNYLPKRSAHFWSGNSTIPSFVLADTAALHHKITNMSNRIRQLEEALAILQSSVTEELHPLLDCEFLKIKSIVELHCAVDHLKDLVTSNVAADSEAFPQAEADEAQADGEDTNIYVDTPATLVVEAEEAALLHGNSAAEV